MDSDTGKVSILTTPPSPSFEGGLLSTQLARLVEHYHHRRYLGSDPLQIVLRFEGSPRTQEAVAIVSALLAYGNVVQIRRSIEDWLRRMEGAASGGSGGAPSPVEQAIEGLATRWGTEQVARALDGWGHRLHKGTELLLLLKLIERSWREAGSVGALFVAGLDPMDEDITQALDAFTSKWKSWAFEMDPRLAKTRSFGHLLSAPRDGSPCKRWCMLLRWMGRRDDLDPGLWAPGGALEATLPPGRVLRPHQLVLPLDTHTGRISQYLGLTRRKSLNWKAAQDATRALRVFEPRDPVRFDWALCRLGILDQCRKMYVAEVCTDCELYWGCRLAERGRASDARRARSRDRGKGLKP